MKFITSTKEVSPPKVWIEELSKHLDIEFEQNLTKVRESDKICLVWNPVAYVLSSAKLWKKELWEYRKKKGKPIYAVERGYLPDCLYIDKNGVLANSSSYNEKNWNIPLTKDQLKKVDKYISDFKSDAMTLEKQGSKRIPKQVFYDKLRLDNNTIKIFIPLQKANDTTILLWADWIKNISNFKKMIINLAKTNNDIVFLVKAHPRRLGEKLKTSGNVINVDNFHYKDCIEYSDIVLAINSGVGLQAMMWEKPTIIVGKAFYQFDGINYKAHNEDEIVKFIRRASKPNMDMVKRFIYFLKYNFYTDCIMKNLHPVTIQRIVFEHPLDNKKVIIPCKQT